MSKHARGGRDLRNTAGLTRIVGWLRCIFNLQGAEGRHRGELLSLLYMPGTSSRGPCFLLLPLAPPIGGIVFDSMSRAYFTKLAKVDDPDPRSSNVSLLSLLSPRTRSGAAMFYAYVRSYVRRAILMRTGSSTVSGTSSSFSKDQTHFPWDIAMPLVGLPLK